jgi:hypothetical protein
MEDKKKLPPGQPKKVDPKLKEWMEGVEAKMLANLNKTAEETPDTHEDAKPPNLRKPRDPEFQAMIDQMIANLNNPDCHDKSR